MLSVIRSLFSDGAFSLYFVILPIVAFYFWAAVNPI